MLDMKKQLQLEYSELFLNQLNLLDNEEVYKTMQHNSIEKSSKKQLSHNVQNFNNHDESDELTYLKETQQF